RCTPHVRVGSFASKATETIRPCTSAAATKADVNSTLASDALGPPGADLNCSAALPQERAGGRAFRCAPCGLLVGERSAPVERLRKLEHALSRRVPAFRRMRVVVQVAAHAHEPRAF